MVEQIDIQIYILAKVYLKEMEKLRSENIILKQQLTSIFKFHCDLCEYKSPKYTALKCHKNREHEDKLQLIQDNKILESENIMEKQTTEI